jgi:hypothetical protein
VRRNRFLNITIEYLASIFLVVSFLHVLVAQSYIW